MADKKEKPSGGCGITRPSGDKGETFIVSATCPAGKKLVADVVRFVKKDLKIK